MDTSEQYIKMCDCEEIQGHRDVFETIGIDDENYDPRIRIDKQGSFWWESNTTWEKTKHIWLPRQDQLQEMVANGDCAYDLFHRFEIWVNWYDNEISQLELSMNQLWLAFVMKERFNKVWDGDSWNG